MSAPAWIEAEGIGQGKKVGPLNRTARAALCSSCGAVIVNGLDADMCAVVARCDVTPLDGVGEVLARLAGRATFTLQRRGGRLELDHRDDLRIAWAPAGGAAYDVLAVHVCGAAPLPAAPSAITPRDTDGWGLPTDPPF